MSGGLRIDVVRVHGFGHFTDYSLELRPGLNLLYGPNEAGKSTLLAFLRGMLFGFDKQYEPETGTWGGELCVSSAAGPLVVRRTMGRRSKSLSVVSPEGKELSASALDEARAHVSRELFHEVFAFSLDELSSFERLSKEDGVSRALFAAGLRGARRLPEVEKLLEARTTELFKKGGRKPRLNDVLLQLEEVRGQLDALKDRPARYLAERERLSSLRHELEETHARLEQTHRELKRLSRLEEALGDLGTLARLQVELASLPPLATFPRDGVVRLEELLQRRKEAHGALARVAALRGSAEREVERLSEASALHEREEVLRAVLGAFIARAELLRTLPGRRVALDARREEVTRALDGLGLEVDEEGLLALELGAAARGQLESLVNRLARAESEQREANGALERARAAHERIVSTLSRLQAERERLPEISAAEVRQRQVALGRAKLLRMEREQVLTQRTESQQRLQSLREQAEPPPGPAPTSTLMAVAVLVAVACVVGMALSAGLMPGLLALLGALVLVVPLVLLHRSAVRSHQREAEAHAARQRLHARELARVQSALDGLMGRRAAVERELATALGEAGLPGDDSVAGLAGMDVALAEALRQAERVEHLVHERAAREAERDGVMQEAQEAELASRRADMLVRTLRGDLSLLLDARGLPANLSAQGALGLWREAAELRRRLADLNADARALSEDESGCAAVVSRLLSEARAVGLGEGPAESVADRVALALEARKAREAEARTQRARVEELRAEEARLLRLYEAEAQAVAALLTQGGGDSEESFRLRARQAERFEELTRQVGALGSRVEAATGLPEARVRESVLGEGGEERLRERLGQSRIQEPALDARLKQLHTELGAAENQLQQWEGDARLAELRIQEERLRAEAAELATRYTKDTLALALLSRARRRFEEEQQPRVIQLASEHFAALTHGRYRRVFLPAGGSRELRVSGLKGERGPEQLSRGTREQLYLAFRLAVIQDFGETRGALPLIVDDILVNFDLARTHGTLELLARLSERHQVIAFTCHPWLRELFEEKGARVVELVPARTEAASARNDAPGGTASGGLRVAGR
ncbi:AAA family ATPase [Melittangium boletus]|uniref:YhaN AAA domain-containing protein n=1 Tax=Melittangium boletus DSM 14713 TaxID=1294270 RepID=A0A250IBR1_9BACT|nr:AAA family ATPase [Melittangium boletus]ATB28650.1 hypothetical protein MEBOL_002099 [Melittangium boletus DSM 14713]